MEKLVPVPWRARRTRRFSLVGAKDNPPSESSKILLDGFLDGMKNLLGESPMQAVFFYMRFAEYADDPAKFHRNLTSVFGDPAVIIERAIVKEVFQRVGLPYEDDPEFEFGRYINLAKKVLSTRLEKEAT